MRAVDTNVLVRLLTRDDPKQTQAAERFVAAGAWVSHLVLMEAVWVLRSKVALANPALSRAIQMVLDHERLSVEGAETVAAALATFQKYARVSFEDCLILESARRAGHLPLGTFDRELGKIDGAKRL
jgi:predicted nucleic-acid-binding protein